MNKNSFQFLGRVGKDNPEMEMLPSGTEKTRFSIAVNTRLGKDKDTGKAKERTDWFDITCFGKLATVVNQYLEAGQECLVEGRIERNVVKNEDGTKVYYNFVADSVQFGAKRGGGSKPAEAAGDETGDDEFPF